MPHHPASPLFFQPRSPRFVEFNTNTSSVEGLLTLFIGVLFTLLVPPKAGDGRPLISFGRWSYFTERESHIIRNRVLLDDPRKARGHVQISRSDIWKTLKEPRIMQHVFLTLVSMSGFQGLTQYTPSLIKSMGFSAIRANALASVPVYCSIVWLTILSVGAYVDIDFRFLDGLLTNQS